jgi:hypothetical protein
MRVSMLPKTFVSYLQCAIKDRCRTGSRYLTDGTVSNDSKLVGANTLSNFHTPKSHKTAQ